MIWVMASIKTWLEEQNQIKFNGCEKGLPSVIYKSFDKTSSGSGIKFVLDQHLADELHKPIIIKFKRRKVYSSFKDNIWGADLADMQLISKYA